MVRLRPHFLSNLITQMKIALKHLWIITTREKKRETANETLIEVIRAEVGSPLLFIEAYYIFHLAPLLTQLTTERTS